MNRLAMLCLFAAVAFVTSTASASSSESGRFPFSECDLSSCTSLFDKKRVLEGERIESFTDVTTVEDCCEKHCSPQLDCMGSEIVTTTAGVKKCRTYSSIASISYSAHSAVIWCSPAKPVPCEVVLCAPVIRQQRVLKGDMIQIFTDVTTVEDCCEKHCKPQLGCIAAEIVTKTAGNKECRTYSFVESGSYSAHSAIVMGQCLMDQGS